MVDSRYPSHLLSLHLLLASSRFCFSLIHWHVICLSSFFSSENTSTSPTSFYLLPTLTTDHYVIYRHHCHCQNVHHHLQRRRDSVDPVQGLQLSSVMYTLTGLPTRFTIITGVCAFVGFSLLILLSLSPNCFQVRISVWCQYQSKYWTLKKYLDQTDEPAYWISWIWMGLGGYEVVYWYFFTRNPSIN